MLLIHRNLLLLHLDRQIYSWTIWLHFSVVRQSLYLTSLLLLNKTSIVHLGTLSAYAVYLGRLVLRVLAYLVDAAIWTKLIVRWNILRLYGRLLVILVVLILFWIKLLTKCNFYSLFFTLKCYKMYISSLLFSIITLIF